MKERRWLSASTSPTQVERRQQGRACTLSACLWRAGALRQFLPLFHWEIILMRGDYGTVSVVIATVRNGQEADRRHFRALLLVGREECAADVGAHDPVASLRSTQWSDFSGRI